MRTPESNTQFGSQATKNSSDAISGWRARKRVAAGLEVVLGAIIIALVPIYLAIGRWAAGGAFFTTESLRYNLALAPAVVFGALVGRRLLAVIPQRVFTNLVLILAGLAAIKLGAGF